MSIELTRRGADLEAEAISVQKAMRSATMMKNEDIVALRDELRGLADRLRDS